MVRGVGGSKGNYPLAFFKLVSHETIPLNFNNSKDLVHLRSHDETEFTPNNVIFFQNYAPPPQLKLVADMPGMQRQG